MIIFRYIGREIYTGIVAITLILLIVFITNQLVHYLNDAAGGLLTMTAVFKIMVLQIPLLLGYLLPLGFYLSILVAFGRMYMDHEMTVLAACGVSRARLLMMVFIIAIGLSIVVGGLMLWVEPLVQDFRTQAIEQAVTDISVDRVLPGQFRKIEKIGVVYAGKVDREHQSLKNVIFVMKNKSNKNSMDITAAASAQVKNLPQMGRSIIFENGSRYIGVPGERNFQAIHYQQYGVKLHRLIQQVNDWPINVSSLELWKIQKKNPTAAAELQWRLAMPISVLLFTLLAVPLSQINPRQGRFARFVPAILIYIAYADLMFLGRAWIQKGIINPRWGLWWVHGIFFMLAIILLSYKNILQLLQSRRKSS